MTDEPERDSRGRTLDPRIEAAAVRLGAVAQGLPVDWTGLLTDARIRHLIGALIDSGALTDEAGVTVELAALEETIEELALVRANLEAEQRRRTLLEGVRHSPNGHGHRG